MTGCAGPTATHGETRQAVVQFGSCAKPEYPGDDLRADHQGMVTVEFLVDASGTVIDSRIAKSTGFTGLDEAARLAIARCHFRPALVDGRPAQQWTPVKYVWTIQDAISA